MQMWYRQSQDAYDDRCRRRSHFHRYRAMLGRHILRKPISSPMSFEQPRPGISFNIRQYVSSKCMHVQCTCYNTDDHRNSGSSLDPHRPSLDYISNRQADQKAENSRAGRSIYGQRPPMCRLKKLPRLDTTIDESLTMACIQRQYTS